LASEVDRVSVRGTWWRQVAAGLDPLELREPPPDGRWQRGQVVAASYLAESEETVWAEWYRALAELAVPPRVSLPRDLWRIEVEVDHVADLGGRERLEAVGLPLPSPGRRGWPAYQEVGERLRREGYAGLVAPSAARPEGRVLCVFRDERPPEGLRAEKRRRVSEPSVPPPGMRT
jgi:RES domain